MCLGGRRWVGRLTGRWRSGTGRRLIAVPPEFPARSGVPHGRVPPDGPALGAPVAVVLGRLDRAGAIDVIHDLAHRCRPAPPPVPVRDLGFRIPQPTHRFPLLRHDLARYARSGPTGSYSVSPRPGTVRRSSNCWRRQRCTPTSAAPARVKSLSASRPGCLSGGPGVSVGIRVCRRGVRGGTRLVRERPSRRAGSAPHPDCRRRLDAPRGDPIRLHSHGMLPPGEMAVVMDESGVPA